MKSLLEILFGCQHKKTTFPITMKPGMRIKAASLTGTYIVCLDCGEEFPYDWDQMKIVKEKNEKGIIRFAQSDR